MSDVTPPAVVASAAGGVPAPRPRRLLPLYLLVAVCIAPVLASYYFYYLAPPSGRTNYGTLVEPQRPLPALATTLQDGTAFDLRTLRGNWVMLIADDAACAEACQKKLWQMRQIRAASGKDAERIERVFLVLDDAPLSTMLLREFDGTHVLRARRAEVQQFLALPGAAGAGEQLSDHIWLIDPLGNQMMRWPRAAEERGIKKDLDRLLKYSRIG
jgi:hypothetical protein